MQERVESDQVENYIVHQPLDRFFINLHAFHNAHLLRATLGREVIAPIPLFPNRQEMHHELAAKLREKQVARDTARKRKRAEDGEGEDEEEEARKKKKPRGRPKKKKVTPPPRAALVPVESMVANRGRRKITQTTRAKATPPESEGDTSDELEDLQSDCSSDYGTISDDAEAE